MLILPQRVEVKWHSATKTHYVEKGYEFTKCGEIFEVDILDLKPGSSQKVKVLCDYCGQEYLRTYRGYNESKKNTKTGKDFCKNCRSIAISESKMKYSYDDAVGIFDDHGFTLIDDRSKYKTSSTRVACRCDACGHEGRKTLSNILEGMGCLMCHYASRKGRGKYTYDEVCNIFADNNCTLLDDTYTNMNEKLEYVCSCGNKDYKTLKSFLKGARCEKCRYKRVSDAKTTTMEEIKDIFSKEGYTVVSEKYDYKDAYKIEYICPSGHKGEMSLAKFNYGSRCPKCLRLRLADEFKLDIDEVRSRFADKGFTLLTNNYINSNQKLGFICKCGNEYEATMGNLRHIDGCPKCNIRSKGEFRVMNHLESTGVDYIPQFTTTKCKNIRPLRFDFAIIGNNGSVKMFIEYDGIQHFEPIDYFGGEDNFLYVKKNDEIKNDYCNENDIPLIRIPYWEFDNIETILDDHVASLV